MTAQTQQTLPANAVCDACGTPFRCGLRAGEPHCWCADLPRRMPVPASTQAVCVCRLCLESAIAGGQTKADAAPARPCDSLRE